jgi:hypothetical protein
MPENGGGFFKQTIKFKQLSMTFQAPHVQPQTNLFMISLEYRLAASLTGVRA